MRDEDKKIELYRQRRLARMKKRGVVPEERLDSVEAYRERRDRRLLERNFKKGSKSVDKSSGKWYNNTGRGMRSDADDVVNGEEVEWITLKKNHKHAALNGEGKIVAGPNAIRGKTMGEVKQNAQARSEKKAESSGGSGKSSSEKMVSAGGKVYSSESERQSAIPKDVTRWSDAHTTKGGVKLPNLKSGAKWNSSTWDRMEHEAEEAGDLEKFTEAAKNLTENDIVYQTESDGSVTACVPGFATRWDKEVVGRSPEIQALYDARRKDGEKITKDMLEIARGLNSSLESVENNFKGGKSASRKIDTKREEDEKKGEEPLTDMGYFQKMDDISRFTMVSGYDEMVDSTNALVDKLNESGYTVEEVDNKWTNPKYKTYKGIHVKARSPEGQMFEVQIHSRGDLAMKDINHEDYNIERDTKKPQAEREAATKRMIERYSTLPMPKGIDTLKSYKKGK